MRRTLSALLISACAATVQAGDFPAFRGPNNNGIVQEENLPIEWSPDKNIVWKVQLGGEGNSSPIVSKGRVFVTVATEKGAKRSLHCYDRKDGQQLWVQTVELAEVGPTHKTNPYCGSTPATDGEKVVVWHNSAGLYCYDFSGKELWKTDLGTFHHIWGYGQSPILHKGKIYLNCGPGLRTFMACLDLESGKLLWQTDEPGGDSGDKSDGVSAGKYVGSWSTPLIATVDGEEQLICSMPTRVVSYNLESGEINWFCEGIENNKGNLCYTSPILVGDICVALGGFGGPGIGFKMGGEGNITESNRLWRKNPNPQRIGSGVAIDGYVYMANAASGLVQCIEPATGEIVWQERAPGAAYWGSIIAADGRCYVTDQGGKTLVFKPNPEKFEQIAVNDLRESTNATPAISDGQIFLRTSRSLFCVGK